MAAEAGLGAGRILADRAAALTGILRHADVIVDPETGNVSVRIEAASPDLALLAGQFFRTPLPRGLEAHALLAPQQAILRRGDGSAQVVVVSRPGAASLRAVTLGERIGNRIPAVVFVPTLYVLVSRRRFSRGAGAA